MVSQWQAETQQGSDERTGSEGQQMRLDSGERLREASP